MSTQYEAFLVSSIDCQKELKRIQFSDTPQHEKWEELYDFIHGKGEEIEDILHSGAVFNGLYHFEETINLVPDSLRRDAEKLLSSFPPSNPEAIPEGPGRHPLFMEIGFPGCFFDEEQVILLQKLSYVPDEIETFFAQRHQSRLKRVASPVELLRAWCVVIYRAFVAEKGVFAYMT